MLRVLRVCVRRRRPRRARVLRLGRRRRSYCQRHRSEAREGRQHDSDRLGDRALARLEPPDVLLPGGAVPPEDVRRGRAQGDRRAEQDRVHALRRHRPVRRRELREHEEDGGTRRVPARRLQPEVPVDHGAADPGAERRAQEGRRRDPGPAARLPLERVPRDPADEGMHSQRPDVPQGRERALVRGGLGGLGDDAGPVARPAGEGEGLGRRRTPRSSSAPIPTSARA